MKGTSTEDGTTAEDVKFGCTLALGCIKPTVLIQHPTVFHIALNSSKLAISTKSKTNACLYSEIIKSGAGLTAYPSYPTIFGAKDLNFCVHAIAPSRSWWLQGHFPYVLAWPAMSRKTFVCYLRTRCGYPQ